MTAEVIDLSEYKYGKLKDELRDAAELNGFVLCPNCKWFKCGMGGTAYDPSMDRCDHPDNLEKKEQFNYKSGPYTRTHNKKHPAALNSNGKCKKWEVNDITEEKQHVHE